MKNIFLVFIQDLKRISTNVVAIVVQIGRASCRERV